MKSRMFLSAAFSFRNLSMLLLFMAIAYLLAGIFPASPIYAFPAAAVIYAAMIGQSLTSKSFHEIFNRREKRREIQNLNFMCMRLFAEAKKHTDPTYYKRIRQVMNDKNDIVQSFFRGQHSYLKEKIVERTLNLVVAYIKLSINFCIRSKELAKVDVGEVAARINTNNRKLGFIKDPKAAEDIKRVIEMDEKKIALLKEEKNDLQSISAKLDFMESSVNMFKHQVIASIESEEMVEKLETAINEATALDNVLTERQKSRINIF